MKVKDYFKRMQGQDDVTFVKARARKNAHSPGYHAEYQTTPICTVRELTGKYNGPLLNSVVLNFASSGIFHPGEVRNLIYKEKK